MLALETRRVRTAVIGEPDSEVPVVLPREAIELDRFRELHEGDTFSCGLVLGGCGGALRTNRHLKRQCHFSHVPLPGGATPHCRRPSVGEASADHLYVKRAMAQLLEEHGQAAEISFPSPIGSLVDVDLRGRFAI